MKLIALNVEHAINELARAKQIIAIQIEEFEACDNVPEQTAMRAIALALEDEIVRLEESLSQ